MKFGAGGERFKKLDSPNPGPGKYNTSTIELSKNGRYSLSNLQNSKVRTFGHSVRSSLANRCQSIFRFKQLLDLETIACQANLGTMRVVNSIDQQKAKPRGLRSNKTNEE